MALDTVQKDRVRSVTRQCIERASQYARHKIPDVGIRFDLKGAAAGMYRVHHGCPEIRYNSHIFARYFEDNLATTVPHEVAHYVADLLYGARNIKPHGDEWRRIMSALGALPRRTHSYDLTGIPRRRERRYTYACNCREHYLSARRHNVVRSGKTRFYCRACFGELSIKPDRERMENE